MVKTSISLQAKEVITVSHQEGNLKERLADFAQKLVNIDYHELSNTHIAYCMAIGRQGIKGFGHTADLAFERFMKDLTDTVADAPSNELIYWSRCCDIEANVALRRAEINNLTSEALSCQIGMAVPTAIEKGVSAKARKYQVSRNQFVTNLLTAGAERLEKRIERESSDALRKEIKTEAGKGEESWSQHVTAELQASLILLSRRFDLSVAMLARYLLVKEYLASEHQKSKHSPRKVIMVAAGQHLERPDQMTVAAKRQKT
jgi:hypothetical protein